MLAASRVFVDIDTQRDFLEPGGALFIAGSTSIIPNLARLTHYAREHHIPIIATACSHTLEDPELQHFAPHCLAGSRGQERVDATAPKTSLELTGGEPLPEDLPLHVTLLKRELDLFINRHADAIISRFNAERPLFVVYGVATDYCVRAAVEGLLSRGCRVALVVDAICAIDESSEADLLTDFGRRDVLMTLTQVVCDTRTTATTA
jgi:nicotinamidase/pyrazinamidase